MDDILKFILAYCSFLYKDWGFKFIDSEVSKSFGGDSFLVLAINGLQVRFVRDRGQLFFDFKPDNTKVWYSIDLMRELINEEGEFHSLMDEENAIFLRDNFKKILNLFSSENLSETEKRLDELKVIRSKKLFG
jgi:hypothetical protein